MVLKNVLFRLFMRRKLRPDIKHASTIAIWRKSIRKSLVIPDCFHIHTVKNDPR